MCVSTPDGILSPTLIVITWSSGVNGSRRDRAAHKARRGAQPSIQLEQERLGRGPVHAPVGDGNPVLELRTIGGNRLSTPVEIALQHQAHDRAIALENLVADVLGNERLQRWVLARVP